VRRVEQLIQRTLRNVLRRIGATRPPEPGLPAWCIQKLNHHELKERSIMSRLKLTASVLALAIACVVTWVPAFEAPALPDCSTTFYHDEYETSYTVCSSGQWWIRWIEDGVLHTESGNYNP
jgi:hypothetical protein